MDRIFLFLLLSLPLIGAYAIFALGIVVTYRASRVLNLAHGAMAMVPAYLFYTLDRVGLPKPVGLIVAILAGGALGYLIERFFVRPLKPVSPTAQTVGTVAAFGFLVAVSSKIWGTASLGAPNIFPTGQISVAASGIKYGEIGLFVVMLVIAGGLFALLQFTDFGLAMRGAADNSRAASLMGVDPNFATSAAWIIGGLTAAIAGIFLAAVTNLHPVVLSLQAVPAFVAVLLGGLGSLPGALIGAALVGATQGLVPGFEQLRRIPGTSQLILAVIALAVMASRGERYVGTDVRQTL